MAELDLRKVAQQLACAAWPDCDDDEGRCMACAEAAAIIAALEDHERLRAAMKLLLNASDILLTVTNEYGDEELTIDDWLRFGASRNAVRAALEEGRDG